MAMGDLRQTPEIQKHTSGSKEVNAGFFMGGRKVGEMQRDHRNQSFFHILLFPCLFFFVMKIHFFFKVSNTLFTYS